MMMMSYKLVMMMPFAIAKENNLNIAKCWHFHQLVS